MIFSHLGFSIAFSSLLLVLLVNLSVDIRSWRRHWRWRWCGYQFWGLHTVPPFAAIGWSGTAFRCWSWNRIWHLCLTDMRMSETSNLTILFKYAFVTSGRILLFAFCCCCSSRISCSFCTRDGVSSRMGGWTTVGFGGTGARRFPRPEVVEFREIEEPWSKQKRTDISIMQTYINTWIFIPLPLFPQCTQQLHVSLP